MLHYNRFHSQWTSTSTYQCLSSPIVLVSAESSNSQLTLSAFTSAKTNGVSYCMCTSPRFIATNDAGPQQKIPKNISSKGYLISRILPCNVKGGCVSHSRSQIFLSPQIVPKLLDNRRFKGQIIYIFARRIDLFLYLTTVCF